MKNIDYRMICKVLKVSNTTVSKFRLLMEGSKGIVPALKKIVMMNKVTLAFEELFSEIFHPGLIGINWKNAWERKINLERKKEQGI